MIHDTDCPRKLPKRLPTGATTVVNLPCNRWTCPLCFARLLQDEVDDVTSWMTDDTRGLTFTLRANPPVMKAWNLLRNRMRREHPSAMTWVARHRDKDGDDHLHGIAINLPRSWFATTWQNVDGTYFEAKPLAGRNHAARCVTYVLNKKHTGEHIQTARSRNWTERQFTSEPFFQLQNARTSEPPAASCESASCESQEAKSHSRASLQSDSKMKPDSLPPPHSQQCEQTSHDVAFKRTQLLDTVFEIATRQAQASNDVTPAQLLQMLPPDDRNDKELISMFAAFMTKDSSSDKQTALQLDAAKLWLTYTTPIPKEASNARTPRTTRETD